MIKIIKYNNKREQERERERQRGGEKTKPKRVRTRLLKEIADAKTSSVVLKTLNLEISLYKALSIIFSFFFSLSKHEIVSDPWLMSLINLLREFAENPNRSMFS